MSNPIKTFKKILGGKHITMTVHNAQSSSKVKTMEKYKTNQDHLCKVTGARSNVGVATLYLHCCRGTTIYPNAPTEMV
jgi:hypothetical protein